MTPASVNGGNAGGGDAPADVLYRHSCFARMDSRRPYKDCLAPDSGNWRQDSTGRNGRDSRSPAALEPRPPTPLPRQPRHPIKQISFVLLLICGRLNVVSEL